MRSFLGFLLVLLVAAHGAAADPRGPLDPNAVPQLLKNLGSDDVKVAASAARSLGVIFAPGGKGSAEEAKPVAAALQEKLTSKLGAALRREAATALGEIRAKEAAEALTAAMNDEDEAVAAAVGAAIAKVLPADDARALFRKRGTDANESLRIACFTGMADLAKGEDAEFLSSGLPAASKEDGFRVGNGRIEAGAVRGLEKAVRAGGKITPETYKKIALVLGSDFVEASDAAMHFLTHIRNEECLAATIAACDARGDGGANDATWRTRANALRTLRHLDWPAYREGLPAVIRNLGDPTANVTNEARNILNFLRREQYLSQEALFPLLLAELEKAESLRLRAGIMAEMGEEVSKELHSRVAKVAAKTLEDAQKDPSIWAARQYALVLLGVSGTTGSLEAIATSCGDDISNVRSAAGKALERLAPLATPEQKVKVAALLLPLLDKPLDWRKTSTAAKAAGWYATPEVVAPLVRLLSHSVINVKAAAGNSLALIARSGPAELKSLVDKQITDELKTAEAAWEYGAPVLGALADAKALPQLTQILGSANWRAQANAALAVAEIAAAQKAPIDNKPLTEALIKVSQSEVVQCQDAANKALRELARGS